MTRLISIFLTAALLALACGSAYGRLPAPAEADKRSAGALYQEGQRLFGQELYSAAIQAFEKAQPLFPAPANLYNIAKCYERMGESSGCVESYKAYLVSYLDTKGQNPPDLADIENSIAKCQIGMRVLLNLVTHPPGASVAIDDADKLVGQTPLQLPVSPGTHTLFITLEGHLPMERQIQVMTGHPLTLDLKLAPELSLTVETEPAGAMITLSGVSHGQTPLTVVRKPGEYQVEITLEGYVPIQTKVNLVQGEPMRIRFTLEEERHVGRVKVSANVRKAAIFIDGKNYGITPYDQYIEVSVGTHQITLTRDRYTPISQSVTVGDGEDVSFHGDLWLKDPPATWKGYLGWTSVGLGAAATAGGYLLGVYAPFPETLYTGTPEYEMWITRQTALYAAGGGLAGLGLFLVILDAMDKQMVDPEDAAQAPTIRLNPTLVQDGLGAIIHGSF